ncbi:SDR family NAD(P)-dependent oxidoreductase [Wenxinia saemankumensis]|uniref:7-alpha-hydroxysteroid dehydrogenase n=1 Tax=Wenxinia saemankumensis TaxID=1447782 RepID=A0A1M6DVU5_9RHOB|nr:SDR family oxidoreductase [Wenxinia saemankumensis]SHI77332.1 7-alpha-hydroxysteroid dehydrogenase [Wenxinia saemankumensis]
MSFSIAGKTAIVTGAANGVGLAIGRRFVEAGANVVFVDRDEETLMREIGDMVKDEGAARCFTGDLREKLTIANLLSLAIDAYDRVDILVNAARQVVPTDPLDPDDSSMHEMLEQNLMIAMRLCQATAKKMIKIGADQEEGTLGSIINLSSIAARRAHPDLLAYSVSTAALDQLTRSLAVALAPHRIRVNAVAFGSVMSASLKGSLKEDNGMRGEIVSHTPLARIAGPGEVSEAVQFLASDSADFVTGQVITVDGGRTLLDAAGVAAH